MPLYKIEDPDSSIRHESDPDFARENELKGEGRNFFKPTAWVSF